MRAPDVLGHADGGFEDGVVAIKVQIDRVHDGLRTLGVALVVCPELVAQRLVRPRVSAGAPGGLGGGVAGVRRDLEGLKVRREESCARGSTIW